MAAKSIPVVGEVFLGDEPGVVKAVKIRYGVSASCDVVFANADDSADTDSIFSVAAGVRVVEMSVEVIAPFAAGALVTIGDSDSVAGFHSSAGIGPTTSDTAGVPSARLHMSDAAYEAGRVYSAAQTIDIVVDCSTTTASPELEIVLFYVQSLDN
jgi:hypothetical protein